MARRSTATSSFGVSRRENHDASGFYDRFAAPAVSADDHVGDHRALDKLIASDARHMDEVPDSSVALVVTSPPYFAGKEYETALGEGAVPDAPLVILSAGRPPAKSPAADSLRRVTGPGRPVRAVVDISGPTRSTNWARWPVSCGRCSSNEAGRRGDPGGRSATCSPPGPGRPPSPAVRPDSGGWQPGGH